MNTIYFFFDDSGCLSKNDPSRFFVYAGYVFISDEEKETAKRKYIHANKAIKKSTGMTGELKAAGLHSRYKRSLYNVLRDYQTVSLCVDISRVYDYILSHKKSICRYKDYVLKMCIKGKLQDLIQKGVVSRCEDICIKIFIDQQLTATNGYYDLRDSIKEELQYGISNFNYGLTHPRLFDAEVTVEIQYCDSAKNYLIQASDILANRVWSSYWRGKPSLRAIPNHIAFDFP